MQPRVKRNLSVVAWNQYLCLAVLSETKLVDAAQEQLIANFKMVVSDTEDLLKATANQGGEALAAVRTKAEKSLAMAKTMMTDAEAALLDRTRAAPGKLSASALASVLASECLLVSSSPAVNRQGMSNAYE